MRGDLLCKGQREKEMECVCVLQSHLVDKYLLDCFRAADHHTNRDDNKTCFDLNVDTKGFNLPNQRKETCRG